VRCDLELLARTTKGRIVFLRLSEPPHIVLLCAFAAIPLFPVSVGRSNGGFQMVGQIRAWFCGTVGTGLEFRPAERETFGTGERSC
jgi:hypothetical protein